MLEAIIIKYGMREYEDETIQSVLQHTDIPYHLTVYDNYPGDENLSVVWNRLIRRSDADIICLLNSDTVVQKDWAKNLVETLTDGVGAVGPVSNHAAGIQGGHKGPSRAGNIEVSTLSGVCLVFPKEVWEEIGGFNESYELYGEDSEFTHRIGKEYKLLVNTGVWIYHHGATSSKAAQERGKDIAKIRDSSKKTFHAYLEKNKSRVR